MLPLCFRAYLIVHPRRVNEQIQSRGAAVGIGMRKVHRTVRTRRSAALETVLILRVSALWRVQFP
jgi:hypothetical protein